MTQTSSLPSQELVRFLRRLRAIREFTAEPIADDVLNAILDVGRWTGTGGNRQPIEVVVVRDASVKQQFGEWGARPAAGAAVALLLVSGGEANMLDEGRMAERLQLAAAAHGLGSTVATLKNEGPANAKHLLGIPAEKRAVALVAIGHTDTEARQALPRTSQGGRKPLSEYAHFDRW